MAVILNEPDSRRIGEALATADDIAISAATVAESLIVAAARNLGQEMRRVIEGLGLEVVPVTAAGAERVARAYERWGKGAHPAGLNFGDCLLSRWRRSAPVPCSTSATTSPAPVLPE